MYRPFGIAFFSLIIAPLCFVVCGCSSEARLAGTITLDDKAVAHAQFQFVEYSGEQTPGATTVAGSTDENGKFDVRVGQIKAGTYMVLVAKYVDKKGNVPLDQSDDGQDFDQLLAAGELRNVLPAKFNSREQSSVTVELTAGNNVGVNVKMVSPGKK